MSEDPTCTDCGGTGETYQTERRCSCQPNQMSEAAKPECPYCGATEGLRQVCDGGGYIAPEYSCEDCFTPRDDGPCFDDLPLPADRKE